MLIVATQEQINKALDIVNVKYEGNVEIRGITPSNKLGTRYLVTLGVKDKNKKGAKFGHCLKKNGEYRRTRYACWHIHGDFFDALINIDASIRIHTARGWIDVTGGNWEDEQIGSMFNPRMFSEACGC